MPVQQTPIIAALTRLRGTGIRRTPLAYTGYSSFAMPTAGLETSEVAFFGENEIPRYLSAERVLPPPDQTHVRACAEQALAHRFRLILGEFGTRGRRNGSGPDTPTAPPASVAPVSLRYATVMTCESQRSRANEGAVAGAIAFGGYFSRIGVDRDFPVLPNGNDSSSVDVARPNVISPISRPPWHRRKVLQKSFEYPPQALLRKSCRL